MPLSHATRAEYYRLGLETGLVDPDEVRDWATSVIARLDEPSAEIIELSWSRTPQSLEQSLRAVEGDRDRTQAGERLLGLLREKHFVSESDLTWCARKAMHIARAAGLDEDVYYEFDRLADEIFLERNNPDGDLVACRQSMSEVLAKYPPPPSPGEA